mmetsp:Transcript_10789/g.35702  ORF Transcript_10789/g.35702 Transcript_10789/m.35702 type:complete len:155 (-) Transcript_10789:493-957(-)
MKGKSVIKSPTSLFSFGLSIVRNEGYLRGLHLCGLSGWIASMSCAFGARMAMYDPVRGAINRLCGTSNSGTAFAAGLCTGALSNFAACPLFLAKTRIQAAAGPGSSITRSWPSSPPCSAPAGSRRSTPAARRCSYAAAASPAATCGGTTSANGR